MQGWNELAKDKSVSGKKISIAGSKFDRGLGTHSNSEIHFELDKEYAWFESEIGVDDNSGANGSVQFKIVGLTH